LRRSFDRPRREPWARQALHRRGERDPL